MVKLNPSLIEEIVRWHLNSVEKLGDRIGGSGHLGTTSLSGIVIKESQDTVNGCLIRFDYSIQTESEFTIYPDNPPPEIFKSGTLFITEHLITKYESGKRDSERQREADDKKFLDSLS